MKEAFEMRRKIRGSVYDTETAKEIARSEHPEWPEVFMCLYRTKSGKYFTLEFDDRWDDEYGEPREPYSIVPKSRREAIETACEILGVERARALFVSNRPDAERTLSVRVSERAYNIIRDVAAERGLSMGQIIEELVNEGEPFGDDSATFDEIAKEKNLHDELLAQVRALRESGDAPQSM